MQPPRMKPSPHLRFIEENDCYNCYCTPHFRRQVSETRSLELLHDTIARVKLPKSTNLPTDLKRNLKIDYATLNQREKVLL